LRPPQKEGEKKKKRNGGVATLGEREETGCGDVRFPLTPQHGGRGKRKRVICRWPPLLGKEEEEGNGNLSSYPAERNN